MGSVRWTCGRSQVEEDIAVVLSEMYGPEWHQADLWKNRALSFSQQLQQVAVMMTSRIRLPGSGNL